MGHSLACMDSEVLRAQLDCLFDSDLMYHGFTKYMRDYELFVFNSVDPRSGLVPWHDRLLFRMCVEADVRSRVRPDTWSRSMGNELLAEHRVTRDSHGYVWGTQSQELYPGATLVEGSERAHLWEREVGVPFHEVVIEANAQTINLVFSDLRVDRVATGHVPYEVGGDSFAEEHAANTKIPLDPD